MHNWQVLFNLLRVHFTKSIFLLNNEIGFYPEITDGCKRADSFRSCLATLRRILGLWNRSMYSNTSALAASGVGYVMRWTRSRLSRPKKPSHAALSPQWPTALIEHTSSLAAR